MLLWNGINVNACGCNDETALNKIAHSILLVKKRKLVIPVEPISVLINVFMLLA